MRSIHKFFAFAIGLTCFACTQGNSNFDHNYSACSAVLSKNLNTQKSLYDRHTRPFNYYLLNEKNQVWLDCLQSFKSVTQKHFTHFTDKQKMAFLMNAHNIHGLKLVVDHQPITSLYRGGGTQRLPTPKALDLIMHQVKGRPEDIKYVEILDKTFTFSQIRHELRKFEDPRTHFALSLEVKPNTGLLKRAYQAALLENQLESATRKFLRRSQINRFSPARTGRLYKPGSMCASSILYPEAVRTVEQYCSPDVSTNTGMERMNYNATKKMPARLKLSYLFKKYRYDFMAKYSSIEGFVAPYLTKDPDSQSFIRSKQLDIEYVYHDN